MLHYFTNKRPFKIRIVDNMKILLLLIGVTTLTGSNAYVLLQVRKGNNQSNVDALIHKVVPSNKFRNIADTARKQFDNYKYNNKKRNDQEGLESIVIAIDSGASSRDARRETTGGTDKIVQDLSNILQEEAINVIPKYRSELEKYHIKPEIVHFRSGKPSVMFEINTKQVIQSIQDFLASKELKHYTDRVASKVAVIYRAIRNEIKDH